MNAREREPDHGAESQETEPRRSVPGPRLATWDTDPEHDGDLIPGFVPHRDELKMLAQDYAEVAVYLLACQYAFERSVKGGRRAYCCRRLDEISNALGGNVVDDIIDREWARYPDLDDYRQAVREAFASSCPECDNSKLTDRGESPGCLQVATSEPKA